MSRSTGDERLLHAYHDGELRGLARWRFERRLGRSPELRRQLEALAWIGQLVHETEAEAPAPSLWEGIALRLPALDARRSEAVPREPRSPLPWLLRPLGAAAAVAVAAALVFGLFTGDNGEVGVVRWIDSGDRNVMVLEGDEDVTIIWVLSDGSPPRGEAREVG